MTNETSDVMARLQALTYIINELKARVLALVARIAAAEQSQGGRWFQ